MAYKWITLFTTPDKLRTLMVGTSFSGDSGLKVVYMVRSPEGNTPIMTSHSDAMNFFNKPWSERLRQALIMSPTKRVTLS